MYEVQVAPGIVWHRHIDQLRPTAVEPPDVQGVAPDTVEASEGEVGSPPPVAIQQSAPPNIGTLPEIPLRGRSEKVGDLYVPLLSLYHDSPSKIVPDFLCATS